MLCATSSSHPPTPLPVKRPCWPILVKALSKVILALLAADVAVGTAVRKSPLNRAPMPTSTKRCVPYLFMISSAVRLATSFSNSCVRYLYLYFSEL